MRLMLHIMIALNALSFAWFSYQESFPESGSSEFQAVSRGVKMIRLVNERELIKDVAVPVQNQTRSVGMCHTIGPLKNHDSARDVVAEIKELGREGSIRTDKRKVEYSYWVYLKSMPDDELDKTIARLEENDVRDYHRNDRNELSLGMYNGIKSATRRQVSIAALGFSPLVGPLYRTEIQYWVDIADMNHNMLTDDDWESYLAEYPGNQRKSVRCDLINA